MAKSNKLNSVRSLWLCGEMNRPSGMSCALCIKTKVKKKNNWKKCHLKFWFFRLIFSNKVLFQMWKLFVSLHQRLLNFSRVFKLALKLHWLADTVTAVYTMPCHRIDILWHSNDVMSPLRRRYFLKKVVPSSSQIWSKDFRGIFTKICQILSIYWINIDS